MPPSYKLTYFNVTGRGEPIRMILSYGGIPFEDIRHEMEDWPKIKPTTPLGELPILEIDGRKITQGMPICRYLANKLNLAGRNITENLAIDVAVEITFELLQNAYDYFFEEDEARKKKLKEKTLSKVPVLLGALEENAQKNGGYVAVNRITWADIVFLWAYEDLRNILNGTDILVNFPNLRKVKQNLLAVKNLVNWIQNRPEIPNFVYYLKEEL